LIDTINETRWDVLRYIRETFRVSTEGNLTQIVSRLTDHQKQELINTAKERLELK